MQVHEHTAIYTALHSPKVSKRFVDELYFILKCKHVENFLYHINNLCKNIKFTKEEESNGELEVLTIFWNRIMQKSLPYGKLTDSVQYLHFTSHDQESCKGSAVSSFFNKAYSIIQNRDGFRKENAKGEWISGNNY